MTTLTVAPPTAVAPARGGPFQRRRDQAQRVAVDGALIAIGSVSFIQAGGDTATMLTPVCLLLAPAILLVRPAVGQWVPLVLATTGFAAFLISSWANDLSLLDVRVLHWASFAVYYAGFLALAGKDVGRAFSLLCGIAIGTMVYYVLPNGPYSNFTDLADFWKYAWAPWVAIILIYALIQLRASVPIQALALLGLAVFSFTENYRSHAMVCFASGTLVVFGWLGAGRLARWVQFAVFSMLCATAATVLPAIALSGIAGEAIRKKTELQQSSGVPTLLAGRTESPLSLTAISERPLFGWGTANNVSPEVFDKATALAFKLGFRPDFPIEVSWYLSNGDVSLHSVLLTGWVEGGVIAALLPIGLLIAALTLIWNAPRYGRWSSLVVLIGVQAVWDLLFSPLSYNLLPSFAILALVFTARHLPTDRGDVDVPSHVA